MIRRYLEYLILSFPIFAIMMIMGKQESKVLCSAFMVLLLQFIVYISLIIKNKGFSIFATIMCSLDLVLLLAFRELSHDVFLIPLTVAFILLIGAFTMLLKDKFVPWFLLIALIIAIVVAVFIKIDFLNLTSNSLVFYIVLSTIGLFICNNYCCKEKKVEKPEVRLKNNI